MEVGVLLPKRQQNELCHAQFIARREAASVNANDRVHGFAGV